MYTIGYARWTLGAVEALLESYGATLVDIRLRPFSRKPGFSGASLAARFKRRYVPLQDLGNDNYRGGPVHLHHAENGLLQLEKLVARSPVILMCACADVTTCHRKVVAELFTALYGTPVTHLEPEAG